MSKPTAHEITRLLRAWSEGDQSALEELAPVVDAQLRRLARGYMRGERAGHVLQSTEVLKVCSRTVKREWNLARAWLYRELSDET
ncbi:MAG TPA: ECF-type sigma factor [Blastocatellia bacterium]|jgi:hypothetical protein